MRLRPFALPPVTSITTKMTRLNTSPTNFGVGVNPTNVAVADLNNDTKPDLAVTNQVSNDVSILIGNGNGTASFRSKVQRNPDPVDPGEQGFFANLKAWRVGTFADNRRCRSKAFETGGIS